MFDGFPPRSIPVLRVSSSSGAPCERQMFSFSKSLLTARRVLAYPACVCTSGRPYLEWLREQALRSHSNLAASAKVLIPARYRGR
jgi:hypothetical protein